MSETTSKMIWQEFAKDCFRGTRNGSAVVELWRALPPATGWRWREIDSEKRHGPYFTKEDAQSAAEGMLA